MTSKEKAKYTYTESRTHELIIEEPTRYTVNMAKYNPNNTAWKNEWRWILQQEDDES